MRVPCSKVQGSEVEQQNRRIMNRRISQGGFAFFNPMPRPRRLYLIPLNRFIFICFSKIGFVFRGKIPKVASCFADIVW
jgi:hypothetical protein